MASGEKGQRFDGARALSYIAKCSWLPGSSFRINKVLRIEDDEDNIKRRLKKIIEMLNEFESHTLP